MSDGLKIILFGTQGGPIPKGKRAATSSALIVDGHIYIIDAGSGLAIRFAEAELEFPKVRAAFITHLHSDHYADLFNFFLLNWTRWVPENQTMDVYGPGRADRYGPSDSDAPGLPDLPAPIVTPENPTPSLRDYMDLNVKANAYDINERLRSTRRRASGPLEFTGLDPKLNPLYKVHSIGIPVKADVKNYCPDTPPFLIHEDEHVRVTATLVNHPPVFPAFAFRFDTRHGSVVFSGDTSPCDNLIRLAHKADILVNEVMAVDAAVAGFAGTPLAETMARQFTSAHTPLSTRSGAKEGGGDVIGVGVVARRAEVKGLVLNHIYPADGVVSEQEYHDTAKADFDGPIFVGRDLMAVDVISMTSHT